MSGKLALEARAAPDTFGAAPIAAVKSLAKDATMKAYLVLDFSIHDLEGFRPYIANVPAFIEKHGGKYIVRGAEPRPIEGDWSPERMVIIEFPSRQNAEQFLDDPGFRELAKVRHKTTTSKLLLVDGSE